MEVSRIPNLIEFKLSFEYGIKTYEKILLKTFGTE